jgi:hypothetical protein
VFQPDLITCLKGFQPNLITCFKEFQHNLLRDPPREVRSYAGIGTYLREREGSYEIRDFRPAS